MAVEVDYYVVLDIARDADNEAIEAAVRRGMREWRKRTEAADLGARQEAEVRVKQLEDARKTLLDPQARQVYDAELAASGVERAQQPAAPQGGDSTQWLQRAEEYLAMGDYHSAAYAARESTQHETPNARTWWIRSRANAGLDLWQDALYEARQAVAMDDNSADFHFHLGNIHEQMNSPDEAIDEYRRAGTCDPSNPTYELAVGSVLMLTGRLEQAVTVVEAVYAKHPQDELANYYMGTVLIELAENAPADKDAYGYIVKSQEEIDQMRSLVDRTQALNILDPETKAAADNIQGYLGDMETLAFRPPWTMMMASATLGGNAGIGGLVVGGCCTLLVFFLPAILLIQGFGSLGQSPGAGIVLILLGGGLGWVWWKLMYVPKWKHNRRNN